MQRRRAPGTARRRWALLRHVVPPPARAASGAGAAGHLAVYCGVKGCRSVWYRPRHEPGV